MTANSLYKKALSTDGDLICLNLILKVEFSL